MPPDRDLIAAAIVSVAGNARAVIGHDAALTRAVSLGVAVAHARTPLLIVGEPGTGRELLARTIHAASGRSGRFVAIDCADIDPAMIESELFGHVSGAFPGAVADRTGRIDGAAQGTIFLGEVALLPMAVQARLANHLDHEARQSGIRPMTARLIASTAFDLDARAINGSFRASLLARLGLVRLALPPLRNRGPDLSLIATHLAHFFAVAEGLPLRDFTDAAMAQLCRHDWPGNIRELEDVVHRAVLISQDAAIPASALMCADGRAIGRTALHPPQLPGSGRKNWPENFGGLVGSTVEDVERTLILETLKACRGNRTSASSILGISVRTMRNKLKTFVEAGMTVAPVS